MKETRYVYGICVKQCEILNLNLNKFEELLQGDLLQILDIPLYGDDKSNIIIKRFNSLKNNFENDVFECARQNTDSVLKSLWHFLIGTTENQSRMRIYNESDLVLGLSCGRRITFKWYGNGINFNIKGEVQMIGTCEKYGIGYFVGLKFQSHPEKRNSLPINYDKTVSSCLILFRIEELIDVLKDVPYDLTSGEWRTIKYPTTGTSSQLQLIDVTVNENIAGSTLNEPVMIKLKKGRYNQIKKKQNYAPNKKSFTQPSNVDRKYYREINYVAVTTVDVFYLVKLQPGRQSSEHDDRVKMIILAILVLLVTYVYLIYS